VYLEHNNFQKEGSKRRKRKKWKGKANIIPTDRIYDMLPIPF